MLTYQKAMATDFGLLSAAADKWLSMAEEIGKVERRYHESVEKIRIGQPWNGVSASRTPKPPAPCWRATSTSDWPWGAPREAC